MYVCVHTYIGIIYTHIHTHIYYNMYSIYIRQYLTIRIIPVNDTYIYIYIYVYVSIYIHIYTYCKYA